MDSEDEEDDDGDADFEDVESEEEQEGGQFRDDQYEKTLLKLKQLVEKNNSKCHRQSQEDSESEEDSGDESDYEFAAGYEQEDYESPLVGVNEFALCTQML